MFLIIPIQPKPTERKLFIKKTRIEQIYLNYIILLLHNTEQVNF